MSKSIVQRFLPIFGSKTIGVFAAFLSTPIIVRILGPERYGEYAFMLSVLGILLLFVNAGVYDGIRKYLKEYNRPDGWKDQVLGFYGRLGFGLALLTILTILVLVETNVVADFLGQRFELYFLLVAGVVVTQQGFSIARSTLMGFDREDVSEKLMIANRLLAIFGGLGLILLGYGVPGLLAAKLLANALLAGVGAVVMTRFVDLSQVLSSPHEDFPRRELLSFNVMSVVLFGLYTSIIHADIFLIQGYYGSTETGFYKAALNLAEFVWFVPRIVQVALLHSTSELWSEQRHERITEISARVTRYSLLFTALLIIGLAILAEPTVALYYGGAMQPAVLPLIILLPGAMGFAVARPILAIGQGKGEFRYLILATGGAAAVNLGLNLLLIPRYGIVGAAVATSTGYFSMLVFHVAGARNIGFDPLADLRLPKVAVTMAVAGIALLGLASQITSPLLSMVVIPPTGFLLYWAIAVAAGAISLEEVRELRTQVPL